MPTLSASLNPNNGRISFAAYSGPRNIVVSPLLEAFAKERSLTVEPGEYVQLESGVYDLHPDIRFAPGDSVPSE